LRKVVFDGCTDVSTKAAEHMRRFGQVSKCPDISVQVRNIVVHTKSDSSKTFQLKVKFALVARKLEEDRQSVKTCTDELIRQS
jgi:hypothetical protein